MPARLHVIRSTGAPFEVVIGNTATIGRTRDNTVCLNHSPLVSRQHAVIRCHNGWQYQLIDLGSTNGTFIGNQRVIMPHILKSGEIIRIGGNEIRFHMEEQGQTDETLAATMAASTPGAASNVAEVALLVCDIRGFSAVAEQVAAPVLAQMLGAWFRDAGNLVHEASGVIDKFIGDALLAYWVRSQTPTEASRALATSRKLLELAASLTWPVSPGGMHVAIALHFGRVTRGNIGLDAERDATVIGDAVNTVFRLEALGKRLRRTVICSEAFLNRLADRTPFEDLGEHNLHGKSKAVRVFALAGV